MRFPRVTKPANSFCLPLLEIDFPPVSSLNHCPRFLLTVTVSPPIPQLSVSTSSITTTVVCGFLSSTFWSKSVAFFYQLGLLFRCYPFVCFTPPPTQGAQIREALEPERLYLPSYSIGLEDNIPYTHEPCSLFRCPPAYDSIPPA